MCPSWVHDYRNVTQQSHDGDGDKVHASQPCDQNTVGTAFMKMTMGKKGSHLMKGTTNRNGVDCTHKNMGGVRKRTHRESDCYHTCLCVCCVRASVCV